MFQGIKFGLKASLKTAGQMILSKISAAIIGFRWILLV